MKAYRMFLPAAVLSFATACGSGNYTPDGGTAGGAGGGSAGGQGADRHPYNVMVKSVPSGSGENCSVTDAGVGTVGTSNVTRVVVGCTIVLP